MPVRVGILKRAQIPALNVEDRWHRVKEDGNGSLHWERVVPTWGVVLTSPRQQCHLSALGLMLECHGRCVKRVSSSFGKVYWPPTTHYSLYGSIMWGLFITIIILIIILLVFLIRLWIFMLFHSIVSRNTCVRWDKAAKRPLFGYLLKAMVWQQPWEICCKGVGLKRSLKKRKKEKKKRL